MRPNRAVFERAIEQNNGCLRVLLKLQASAGTLPFPARCGCYKIRKIAAR
jgi:hypothetical protein